MNSLAVFLKNKPWLACLPVKMTQIQRRGQELVRRFAYHLFLHNLPQLWEGFPQRARVKQTGVLGNCWVTQGHQAGQQELGLRGSQVSSRICTSEVFPLLCDHTCHSGWVHPLAWRAFCEKSASSPSLHPLSPCWMQSPRSHCPTS